MNNISGCHGPGDPGLMCLINIFWGYLVLAVPAWGPARVMRCACVLVFLGQQTWRMCPTMGDSLHLERITHLQLMKPHLGSFLGEWLSSR